MLSNELKPDTFCIAPWTNLTIWSSGSVFPCCMNPDTIFGNTNDSSIAEIYNSPVAKNFRKEILSGQLPQTCNRCKLQEKDINVLSYRQFLNDRYKDHQSFAQSTEPDGELRTFNFIHIDIRITNLCNFGCRMCDSTSSSRIASEMQKLGELKPGQSTLTKSFPQINTFLDFFMQNKQSIQEFYFTGGEPSVIKEHYEILEKMIEWNLTHIKLRYNMNMSHLSLGGKSLLKLWRHFSHVEIGASLDGSFERAKYIRYGTDWAQIEENCRNLRKECPHVRFTVAPTVQILNAFELPNFHLDWIARGLIDVNDVHYNILSQPSYFALHGMPKCLKEKFTLHWQKYIAILKNYVGSERIVASCCEIIKYAHLADTFDQNNKTFNSEIDKFDRIRKQDFNKVFPELLEMRNEIQRNSSNPLSI